MDKQLSASFQQRRAPYVNGNKYKDSSVQYCGLLWSDLRSNHSGIPAGINVQITLFRNKSKNLARLVHFISFLESKKLYLVVFTRVKKILEHFLRTRFFMGFEITALFFPAT